LQSSKYPHIWYYPEAQGYYHRYGDQKVEVTGHFSEVGRCYYGTSQREVTGQILAEMTRMGWQPFAVKHFQRWYNQLTSSHHGRGDEAARAAIPVMDLFFWEQKLGRWLAMAHSELDIRSRDILTPFNCRRVLQEMLLVNESHRRAPFNLHRKIIEHLWPELLSEPINRLDKPSFPNRARHKLRTLKQAILASPS
jgi:hypothetical protein